MALSSRAFRAAASRTSPLVRRAVLSQGTATLRYSSTSSAEASEAISIPTSDETTPSPTSSTKDSGAPPTAPAAPSKPKYSSAKPFPSRPQYQTSSKLKTSETSAPTASNPTTTDPQSSKAARKSLAKGFSRDSRPPETLEWLQTPVTLSKTSALTETERQASLGVTDWATSFHGISTKPVSKEQFDALMQPLAVSDIEVKPDGVIYLPEIRYRRRLNQAFGPMGWGLIPKGEVVVGKGVVTREYALFVNGRFVSQAQGENQFFTDAQLPASVEGCKSNALMRCCKDLGIASELWDPSFIRWFRRSHMEGKFVEHTITKKKSKMWFRKNDVTVAYPFKLAE